MKVIVIGAGIGGPTTALHMGITGFDKDTLNHKR